MSTLRLAGAVFDADGTLFDTERLALEVWLGVAREWDAPGIEAHYLELVGRNREGIVALLRQVTPPDFPLDDFLLDTKYHMPISHVDGNPLDMSFSGLKTAVINLVHGAEQRGEELDKPSLAASFTRAVSDSLVPRTMEALRTLGYDRLAVAGGVAANSRIRRDFTAAAAAAGAKLYIPPLKLCGDNAAMIGSQAYYEYISGHTAGAELNAYATLEL